MRQKWNFPFVELHHSSLKWTELFCCCTLWCLFVSFLFPKERISHDVYISCAVYVCGFGWEKRKESKGARIQFLRSLASWLFLVRCLFEIQVNWVRQCSSFLAWHYISWLWDLVMPHIWHLAVNSDTKRKTKRQIKQIFKKNIQWPSYKCTLKKKREKHVAKWIDGEEPKRKLAPCRAH